MATTAFTDLVTLVSASWLNDVDTSAYAYLTSPAGTNTITGTGGANLTYAAGLLVRWIPAGTNTGATTLNITPSGASALGAKNVFAGGAACVGGEITINVPTMAIYDGTQFNIVAPLNITKGSTSTTFTFDGTGGTSAAVTVTWQKIGSFVTLNIPSVTATTGTNSQNLTSNTAIAAGARPTAAQEDSVANIINNGVTVTPSGAIKINTNGTITIVRDANLSVFTDTAAAGLGFAQTFTYYTG